MEQGPETPQRFPEHVYPQLIPDPDEIRPGPPPPWAEIDVALRSGLSLERVLAGFEGARRRLADSPIPHDPTEAILVADAGFQAPIRRSAVLVHLFEEEGETNVVLTRRAASLRAHRGEVSFPGGRLDDDETPIEGALREAREEVGLARADPVGWLHPLVTLASSSVIWPVVSVGPGTPVLRANPSEVERILTVRLTDLVADDVYLSERWRREELRPGADGEGFFPIHFFRVPGELVWGATARILVELLSVALGVEWRGEGRDEPESAE